MRFSSPLLFDFPAETSATSVFPRALARDDHVEASQDGLFHCLTMKNTPPGGGGSIGLTSKTG
jgi:hypothetical protein